VGAIWVQSGRFSGPVLCGRNAGAGWDAVRALVGVQCGRLYLAFPFPRAILPNLGRQVAFTSTSKQGVTLASIRLALLRIHDSKYYHPFSLWPFTRRTLNSPDDGLTQRT
jgi:hypothetical protein